MPNILKKRGLRGDCPGHAPDAPDAPDACPNDSPGDSPGNSLDEGIAQYRLIRMLDGGGTARVYLGEHFLLGNRVALKVLKPEARRPQLTIYRFLNDARKMAAIKHEGVVRFYDFTGTRYMSVCLIMEYLQGESLADRLRRHKRLSVASAVRVARQVAHALAAAHNVGVVHQNLKPSNIMLVPDRLVAGGERAKLVGFRGFRWLRINSFLDARPGHRRLLGPPLYMAPEQCGGAGDIDGRADVYALGCVLFHMLYGVPPFPGASMSRVAAAHLGTPAPVPQTVDTAIPTRLNELIRRALAKEPAARHKSIAALLAAITDVEGEITATASPRLGSTA